MQALDSQHPTTSIPHDDAPPPELSVRLAQRLFNRPSRSFPVRLWNGTVLEPTSSQATNAILQLNRPWALLAFLPPWSERRLAQAYIDKDIDVVGGLVELLHTAGWWRGPAGKLLRPLNRFPRWPLSSDWMRHSQASDLKHVSEHYDGARQLIRLFLDPELVYSCGYFERPDDSLEQAQLNKLELICRKLALEPTERLLDIGCGWGALLRHAAREHRVLATGITLSSDQFDEATRRAAELPKGSVEVRRTDYRELGRLGSFDKVASVGMMEHVGRAHLDTYFRSVFSALRPGGLFLNQAIADLPAAGRLYEWTGASKAGNFVESSIFPGTELPALSEVLTAAETVGFEVRDVESLKEHYDQTLCAWLSRLESRSEEAFITVGEAKTRAFKLYLACTAAAFRSGTLSTFQTLLRRPESRHTARCAPPRSRATWTLREPDHAFVA